MFGNVFKCPRCQQVMAAVLRHGHTCPPRDEVNFEEEWRKFLVGWQVFCYSAEGKFAFWLAERTR